jgi:uncharacterized Tic20 family protein
MPTAGEESVNFQLDVLAVLLSAIALSLLVRTGWRWFLLLVPNLSAFGMAIFGAARASQGRVFRYPFVLRLSSSPHDQCEPGNGAP